MGEGKEQRTDRGDQGASGQELPGPQMVCQNPRRDLHGHIAVKIECREIPQGGGPDPEIAHQLVRHHGGGHPLVEAGEVEESPESPDEP